MESKGKVYLIGAGPGDPELLTIKALKMLQEGQVVIYDRLVSPEVLALASEKSTKISVGKSPDYHPVTQEEINQLLVKFAKQGQTVVRLKGGDPFIFGRGAEEAIYLKEKGIKVEYSPGITAVQGASLSSGVPLTFRKIATSVQIITGHNQKSDPLEFDWASLAKQDTTLVVYMGVSSIGTIAENLIVAGLNKNTPVLAVTNATMLQEQRLFSQLDQIAKDTLSAGLKPPTVFIIGKVVSTSIDTDGT